MEKHTIRISMQARRATMSGFERVAHDEKGEGSRRSLDSYGLFFEGRAGR